MFNLSKYAICMVFMIQYLVCHGLTQSPTDCLIKNQKYQFEYLYSANDEDDSLLSKNYQIYEENKDEKVIDKRKFETNDNDDVENKNTNNVVKESRQAYVYPLGLIYDYDLIKWSIIPSALTNQSFHIKSKNNNQYLCASPTHTNMFFKTRRKVFTHTIDDLDELNKRLDCMWKFEKFSNQMKSFIIWNVKYKEPLYAASSLFYEMELGRNVYTWHKKPDSDQFHWNLHCMK